MTNNLQGGGLQYTRYRNSDKIDHFRVNSSQRVSCESLGGDLLLRHITEATLMLKVENCRDKCEARYRARLRYRILPYLQYLNGPELFK